MNFTTHEYKIVQQNGRTSTLIIPVCFSLIFSTNVRSFRCSSHCLVGNTGVSKDTTKKRWQLNTIRHMIWNPVRGEGGYTPICKPYMYRNMLQDRVWFSCNLVLILSLLWLRVQQKSHPAVQDNRFSCWASSFKSLQCKYLSNEQRSKQVILQLKNLKAACPKEKLEFDFFFKPWWLRSKFNKIFKFH